MLELLAVCLSISFGAFLLEIFKKTWEFSVWEANVYSEKGLNAAREAFSLWLSIIPLTAGLIISSVYFINANEREFRPEFTVAISTHLMGVRSTREITKWDKHMRQIAIAEHISVVEISENWHRKCFDNVLYDVWNRGMFYLNKDGVIQSSYRAFVKERNMFIHCTEPMAISSTRPGEVNFILCVTSKVKDKKIPYFYISHNCYVMIHSPYLASRPMLSAFPPQQQ